MESFITGEIIVVKFPFSDYSNGKRRPAVIIKSKDDEDFTICPITSSTLRDDYSIDINNESYFPYNNKTLRTDCSVKCNFLSTINKNIIEYKVGKLKSEIFNNIKNKVIDYIKS